MKPYPYHLTLTKSVANQIVPAPNVPVRVFDAVFGGLKNLSEDIGMQLPITQPVYTDSFGRAAFFTSPGRIRIEAAIDAVTTQVIEDTIADADAIVTMPNGTGAPSMPKTRSTLQTTDDASHNMKLLTDINTPVNTAMLLDISLVAECTAGPSLNACAAWRQMILIHNGDPNVPVDPVIMGGFMPFHVQTNALWQANVTAGNGTLYMTVRGTSGDTIIWDVAASVHFPTL